MIASFGEKNPAIHESAFVAPGAIVIGDVRIGEDSSLWYYTVARGDQAPITVGKGTNVQDGSVLHVSSGNPCEVGEYVTIGHRAVVHGARVGDMTIVGIGAVVLDGVEIGEQSIIAAGSIVPPGKKFPARSFILGVPGRLIREVTEEELKRNLSIAEGYLKRAKIYKELKEQPPYSY